MDRRLHISPQNPRVKIRKRLKTKLQTLTPVLSQPLLRQTRSDGEEVQVTFTLTTRNTQNFAFWAYVKGSGSATEEITSNDTDKIFTYPITVGADPKTFQINSYENRTTRVPVVVFTYALESLSASIDSLVVQSGEEDVAGVATFNVSTAEATAPVTLTIEPSSNADNPTFTATASINGQSTAFTSQGSGDNLRLVLNRDFPIGDTEVAITLNDGQGNEDTRTITVEVDDSGPPVFTKVSGALDGVTREITSFPESAPFPLLKVKTKDESGNKTVTYTVTGTDNSGDTPTIAGVDEADASSNAANLVVSSTPGQFTATLAIDAAPIAVVITLTDGDGIETERTVRLQVVTSGTSIDDLQVRSGTTTINLADSKYTVPTTGTNAPITVTFDPDSTEDNARFTATASINGQSTAFASQGSGDNLRLVLNRDFPIGDTEVVIALNDGQGNEDSKNHHHQCDR